MLNPIIFVVVFWTLSATVYAQYPFDSLPKPNWSFHNNWKTIEPKNDNKLHETITIAKFYDDSTNLTLQFTMENAYPDKPVNILRVYRGAQVIQSFRNEIVDYHPGYTSTYPIRVGDITRDGKKDIKIIYDYHSNGLGLSHRPIYLIQQDDGRFIKYSFYNSFVKRLDLERDFDEDGRFEIISVNLIGHNNHSYWQFDVFKIDKENFTSENEKYGYPIYVQFLHRNNFKPSSIKPKKDQSLFRDLEFIVDTGTAID